MKTLAYPALLIRDRGDDGAAIGVVFPDLPGCVSQGDTPQDAAEMAAEALGLHIDAMTADGDPLPSSSALGAVPDWIDLGETVIVAHLLVPVSGRGEAVAVPLDPVLLRLADEEAASQGVTRAHLLAEAIRAGLHEMPLARRRRAS